MSISLLKSKLTVSQPVSASADVASRYVRANCTIFAICPCVTLSISRKYGRFPGPHCSQHEVNVLSM